MSILRIDGVRREIGDFVILDSVSAALARGERTGLVGGNGAGKTTLLEIIAGREEADGGRVHTESAPYSAAHPRSSCPLCRAAAVTIPKPPVHQLFTVA